MDAPLLDRVALVTGSAKRLGRAVALRLAQEGAHVVIHYRSSEAEARAVVAEIEKLGRRGIALPADLTRVSEIGSLFDQAAAHFKRLDILVNSAANFVQTEFASTTEQLWNESLDTNLKALFFCAQAAAPLLKQTRGTIINFADIGGLLAWPGYIPHCVSKAGVMMLTKCLAKQLAPEIRVNAIAPGTITMSGDPSEWESDFIRLAPLHRTGIPADIAGAVSFLIRSDFITGQVLVLDGGRTI
jgi:NAD(P)-dependent dehydrogenase (short-subunit alcohol dehydrogenase family)